MKKTICLFIAVSITVFCLCSCGSNMKKNKKDSSIELSPEEKMIEYIVENGQKNEKVYYVSFQEFFMSSYTTYFVVYNDSTKEISFESYEADGFLEQLPINNDKISQYIKINYSTDVVQGYYKQESGSVYTGSGKVDKSSFNSSYNDELSDLQISGKYPEVIKLTKQLFTSNARLLLTKVNTQLKEWDVGMSLNDLGYAHF